MAWWALSASKRIATKFYAAVGLTCLILLITIIVALISFERINSSQRMIFERTLPDSEVVIGIARTSGAIVAAVPRLTAAISLEELESVSASVADLRQEFESQLTGMRSLSDVGYSSVSEKGSVLLTIVGEIEESMHQLFAIRQRGKRFRTRLGRLEQEIRRSLIPMIDDQYFYAITGRRELGEPPAPRDVHFSEGEVHLYRYLSDIEKETNIAIQLLATTAITNDIALLGVVNQQFNSSGDRILSNVRAIDDPDLVSDLEPLLDELVTLGLGEANELNGFAIREAELRLLNAQRNLISQGRNLSDELIGDAQDLVGEVNKLAQSQASEASAELESVRLLLIGLGLFGIGGAIVIVWLLVGRVLLARLRYLSTRMSDMAQGDLSEEVLDSGGDEIAEMANALEIFRQRALEAQRLNLVEELAEELREKNEAMQVVVDELRTAQNQIVMREKLAALGELTAGVAHEIKNPLNFVKNFSESSKELVGELGEIVDDKSMPEEEREEEIKSISEMLIGNFDRILEHGNRAVRIVNDMLRIGRDSGTSQETDINQLVEQHAKLAYHGARTSIEDFQAKLDFNLDPDVGTAIIVSQEIGRVILNMVGNSCYAAHEKRMSLVSAAGDGNPIDFSPALKIGTIRVDGKIRITIRDNGCGIPESLVQKVFNPFFTTKPTDQGTGLGLAMSSDIIQKHGGSISVDSREGEFTEMTVEIPVDASKALSIEDEKTDDESLTD